LEYLNKNDISKELAIKANLINERTDPIFSERIMFPIINEDKKIIGFSGRDFYGKTDIKYLNTNTNPLFKKSEVIYNINNIKNQFITEIIILEGFMDVITLDKINIKNSVAIMGTSFSSYHTNILSKIASRFILALDNDRAGENASVKIAEELFKKNLEVKTIKYNSDYKDFNDILLKESKEKIESIFLNKYDFIIDYLEKKEIEAKEKTDPFIIKTALDNINKILSKISEPVIKNMYSQIISEKFKQKFAVQRVVENKKVNEFSNRHDKQEINSMQKAVYQIMYSKKAAEKFDKLMNMSFFGPIHPEDKEEYFKMTNSNKKKILLEKIACISYEYHENKSDSDITSFVLNNIEDYMHNDFLSFIQHMEKEDYRQNNQLKVYNIYSLVDIFKIIILKELNRTRLNYKLEKTSKQKRIDDLNQRIKILEETIDG
jgi:DNA primase